MPIFLKAALATDNSLVFKRFCPNRCWNDPCLQERMFLMTQQA